MTRPGSEVADAPEVHAFALADLEERFWSANSWYRRDDGVVGIVSLPDGEGEAVYAVSTRDPVAAIGAVHTHPVHRGIRLGRFTMAAVIQAG